MRFVLILVTIVGVIAPSAAATSPAAAAANVDVVASFYPLAYAAQRVGDGRVSVDNLTPAGAEPHDLELTTKQIDAMLDADVALVMGHRFQPAVEQAAARRDGPTVALLERLPRAEVRSDDPHVWLDPVLMRDVVEQVRRALTKADPKGAATYRRNAAA